MRIAIIALSALVATSTLAFADPATARPRPANSYASESVSGKFVAAANRYPLVTSEQSDALSEGDAVDATSRAWTRCVIRVTRTTSVVTCPDGFIQRD